MATSQLELALADRREGQDVNLAAGTTGHRDDTARVESAIAGLVRRGVPFTSNDVHVILGRDGHGDYNRNLVSSRIGILAAQGVIYQDRSLTPEPARQRSRKGSRNPWWRPTSNRSTAA